MINDFFTPVPKKRRVKIRGGKGIIFNNLSRPKIALFYVTTVVFVGCLSYLLYLYAPIAKAVFRYQITKQQTPNNSNLAVVTPLPSPTPSNEFVLNIPKIEAKANIVGNVSPFNKDEYTKILEQNNVALAKGSEEPGGGKGKSTFIFAHSTEQGISLVRNNSTFYLLDELATEDKIFVNMRGKVYEYRVYDKKIVRADDVEYLAYSDPDKEVLILQTCWPLGTDWKRLLVFGELITN